MKQLVMTIHLYQKKHYGATDALCYWLRDAKDLIDGFDYKTDKNTQSQRSAKNE